MLFVAGLLSLCLFAQPRSGEATASIVKAVLETNAKMLQAANQLNADLFFDYILESDPSVLIQNGTVFKTREEAFQAVKRGFQGMQKMNRAFDNPQVTVLGPELALLTSEGTLAATLADGRAINGRFAVSLIFVQKSGQWKLIHGHYSTPARNP